MSEQVQITNRELMYKVAELRGHKIEVYPRGSDYHASVYFEGSVIIDGNLANEARAHLAVTQCLPAYLADVDVALTLPIDHERLFWVLLPRDAHGDAAATLYWYDWQGDPIRAYDRDGYLATAMCKAWVKLQELQL